MFSGLFAKPSKEKQEGERLFLLGMEHASRFESDKAIELYTRSIEINPNPSPYMNRANLLGKRARHFEALLDLAEAKRLDEAQSNEFGKILAVEIIRELEHTAFYRDGMRERLLVDYEQNDVSEVGKKIMSSSFDLGEWPYWRGRSKLEYHFFNELDNIIKFEDTSKFPEAEEYLSLYGQSFIDHKISVCPDEDFFNRAEKILHSYLCVYTLEETRYLRRHMLWDLHNLLLEEDYGNIWSLSSTAKETIREFDSFPKSD